MPIFRWIISPRACMRSCSSAAIPYLKGCNASPLTWHRPTGSAPMRDLDAMSIALDRLGQRLKRGNALLGSAQELITNYAELEADFAVFFPDLVRFVRGDAVKSEE